MPRKDILATLEISPATFKHDIAKLRDWLGTPIQSMIEQLTPGLLGPKLKPLRKRLDDTLNHRALDPLQLTLSPQQLIHCGRRSDTCGATP